MKLRLLVGHRGNSNTKVKMAKVDGCTFFRNHDGSWRHVHKSCKQAEHSIFKIEIKIGECTLVREGGRWVHSGKICAMFADYSNAQQLAEEARQKIGNETDKNKKVELTATIEKAEKMAKPSCALGDSYRPWIVDGSEFELVGDVFHHLGHPRRQQIFTELIGQMQVRMTRFPGWWVSKFAEAADKALQSVHVDNPHDHITVEV